VSRNPWIHGLPFTKCFRGIEWAWVCFWICFRCRKFSETASDSVSVTVSESVSELFLPKTRRASDRTPSNSFAISPSVVHRGLLVARGKENVWDTSLYSTTRSSPYYSLATPLLTVCVFQAARFCALYSRVNFLLHRRGQTPTSLANRGGIPIAGQL
jgi:hypothetical protein